MVLRPSLKRVVPGSVPPGARLVLRGPAVVSGCRASIFAPLPWFSTSGRKHGSDALARLKRPCCGAAPFFVRRQATSRSRRAVGVASEALRSRCFLTNLLCKTSASWFVFLEGQDPWLRAKKLLLLFRRSPLNAACQLLCRSCSCLT